MTKYRLRMALIQKKTELKKTWLEVSIESGVSKSSVLNLIRNESKWIMPITELRLRGWLRLNRVKTNTRRSKIRNYRTGPRMKN